MARPASVGSCPARFTNWRAPPPHPPPTPHTHTHTIPTPPTHTHTPVPCDPSRSKGNFADMFLRLLRDEGAQEEWQVFTAWEGQLPTAEQLAEFDGFVITGSV